MATKHNNFSEVDGENVIKKENKWRGKGKMLSSLFNVLFGSSQNPMNEIEFLSDHNTVKIFWSRNEITVVQV